MNKADALEAAPIVIRCCQNLMTTISPTGLNSSAARTQIGDTIGNAYLYLRADTLGPELDQCFTMVRQAGATLGQIEQVRTLVAQEAPKTLGATLVQNTLIQFCLATKSEIIGNTTFISREDVDAVKQEIQQPFLDAEEQAADAMDQMVFQALMGLHGATVNYLVTTERPLPQMLSYQFAVPLNILVVAYRLYSDASRADQVRAENKIVHPAFAPRQGRALSG